MNSLRITSWNINGLINKSLGYTKLSDENFVSAIHDYDIIGLLETHLTDNDEINIKGYKSIIVNRKMNPKAKRSSGGIAVLIKNKFNNGVKIMKKDDISIWVKLDKRFFACDKDIFLGFVYLPPENSSFLQNDSYNILHCLEQTIEEFSIQGDIVMMGDFNGRTAERLDYVVCDSADFTSSHVYETDSEMTERTNQDKTTNKRGEQLLDLCIAARLRMLNGRIAGDTLGSFTCHKYNGSSTIDYGIVSNDLLKHIVYFHVHDLNSSLSDHCQISLRLHGLYYSTPQNESETIFKKIPPTFKWNDDSEVKFQYAFIEHKSVLIQLEKDLSSSNSSIDNIVTSVTNVFNITAKKSLTRNIKLNNTNNKHKQKKWYNPTLQSLRRELNNQGILLSQNPHDPITRRNYFYLLRNYRKKCKNEKRKFTSNILTKLDELHENNPSQYWKLFKMLSNANEIIDKDLSVNKSTLYQHYKGLNEKSCNDKNDDINPLIDALDDFPCFNELDSHFTEKEIRNAINKLRKKKAPGPDMISNEMIKAASPFITGFLQKLFNKILLSGSYPSLWAKGRIISIHKSGDKNIPSNYRGITISSSLGKLFNSILNNRLLKFLKDKDVLDKHQIGFQAKCRTTDHLFILKNLIMKFTKAGKPLYLAFIDFKKAFDSIWHDGLLAKLSELGVSTHLYKLIKSMYTKTKLTVQHGDEESPEFLSQKGVRQGDNLSPLLFNIYINDIPKLFDCSCAPVKWGDMDISCLMYADDIVILSESSQGLQNALNKLSLYCKTWKLDINTNKTKVMCTRNSEQCNFNLNDRKLEEVSEFRYLGILLDKKGSDTTSQSDLYKRSLKAYFKIFRNLNPLPGIKTLLHLFDHLIKPILLYGCEIWTPINLAIKETKSQNVLNERQTFLKDISNEFPLIQKFINTNSPAEKLHLNYCKRIMGVHKNTANLGIYSELGRYPLFISQITNTISFYKHIIKEDNTLLFQFWTNYDNLTLPKSNFKTFTETLERRLSIGDLITCKKDIVKRKLHQSYVNYWRKKIQTNISLTRDNRQNKLRTYKEVKQHFKLESYLNLKSYDLRKKISQFRLSAHMLRIERDRYSKTYTRPSERICLQCDMKKVEDEHHFLLECTKFQSLREQMFETAETMNIHFRAYNNKEKFLWLNTSENIELLSELGKFLSAAFLMRNDPNVQP